MENPDLYSDSPEPAPEQMGQEDPGEKEHAETALIPKSLLMGKDFKPGEEVVFKIMRFHDDEVEIAYATGEEKKEGEGQPAPEPAAMPSGGGEGGDLYA